MRKSLNIIVLILLFFVGFVHGTPPDNIRLIIKLQEGEKEAYEVGDRLQCNLTAIQSGKYCSEGVGKVRLFVKGLKVEDEQDWVETSAGVWNKKFSVVVIGNKKGDLQLTVYRKTDKGSVVETMKLKLKE